MRGKQLTRPHASLGPAYTFRRDARIALVLGALAFSAIVAAFTAPAKAQLHKIGRSVLDVPQATAGSQSDMQAYTEIIEHSDVTIDMTPIPAGKFLMGSRRAERERNNDEGPQRKVLIETFWMSKFEITWDAYEVWMLQLDIRRRQLEKLNPTTRDKFVDAITGPTKPYTDMTFGMGKEGYPAICMTQLAAKTFCRWLSAKTGRYYRLPTEAEWEYACRAGTTTAYHFGDAPDKLDEYAWHYGNSGDTYHKVGRKKPNLWGLYDMHGNVTEWVLDQYLPNYGSKPAGQAVDNPLATPTRLYPRVVRGGSWDDDPETLRSAARGKSDPSWKDQDPQLPKSIWYHTDALHVGFRVIRPLREPSDREKQDKWEKSLPVQDTTNRPKP